MSNRSLARVLLPPVPTVIPAAVPLQSGQKSMLSHPLLSYSDTSFPARDCLGYARNLSFVPFSPDGRVALSQVLRSIRLTR